MGSWILKPQPSPAHWIGRQPRPPSAFPCVSPVTREHPLGTIQDRRFQGRRLTLSLRCVEASDLTFASLFYRNNPRALMCFY